MIFKITVIDALMLQNKAFVDVRSPLEFEEGTIPGAINIPLLDNNERAEIGRIYKKISPREAKIRGLQLIGPKLGELYDQVDELSRKYEHVIVLCWRGGLRSASIVNLLSTLGVRVYQLEGGYKSYRSFVLDYINDIAQKHQFLVLHGHTGVGKTEILEKLDIAHIPVLNLEALAQNSGSVFGSIYPATVPINQKNFEALIVNQLFQYGNSLVITESESKRIGSVHIPNPLYESILAGKHMLLDTTLPARIDRLVKHYVNSIENPNDFLMHSIKNLRKRMGNEKVEQYTNWIFQGAYQKVALDLVANYYDPLYEHSIKKYHYDFKITYDKIEEAIKQIKHIYRSMKGMIHQ